MLTPKDLSWAVPATQLDLCINLSNALIKATSHIAAATLRQDPRFPLFLGHSARLDAGWLTGHLGSTCPLNAMQQGLNEPA